MRFRRPVPAVTAPLEDSPAPAPPRFRWLKRGILLCAILWLGIIATWFGLNRIAQSRLAAEIEAVKGEPLRLEFESFLAAVQGRAAVTVSGKDGREALDVALRIQTEIERTLAAANEAGGQRA